MDCMNAIRLPRRAIGLSVHARSQGGSKCRRKALAMKQCRICCWYNDGHDVNCPRELSPDQEIRYNAGWKAGRKYNDAADPQDPIYMFGYINGDIAADVW